MVVFGAWGSWVTDEDDSENYCNKVPFITALSILFIQLVTLHISMIKNILRLRPFFRSWFPCLPASSAVGKFSVVDVENELLEVEEYFY